MCPSLNWYNEPDNRNRRISNSSIRALVSLPAIAITWVTMHLLIKCHDNGAMHGITSNGFFHRKTKQLNKLHSKQIKPRISKQTTCFRLQMKNDSKVKKLKFRAQQKRVRKTFTKLEDYCFVIAASIMKRTNFRFETSLNNGLTNAHDSMCQKGNPSTVGRWRAYLLRTCI